VLGLVAVLLAASAALWLLVGRDVANSSGDRWMPWWLAGLLFAAAEVFVLHVQVRREARTISLSDIPLVLALYFASPGGLVMARVVLPLLIFLFVRRQPLIKTLFNTAVLITEGVVAVVAFGLVVGTANPDGPIGWAGAYAAAAAGGILSAGAVAFVIRLHEDRIAGADFLRTIGGGALVSAIVTTPALVAVEALHSESRSVGLLFVCGVVVFTAYRAYASLSERHLSLERLYRFSQVVSSSPEVDEVLGSVLTQARELLRAESAELSLLATDNEGGLRFRSDRSGGLDRQPLDELDTADWLWARTIDGEEPLVLPRGSRDVAIRRYLERRNWRDAIVVPLRGESGVIGTLAVADRLGDVRTFDTGDAQLLGTVANHASVALQNGRLLQRLHHEALHDALTGLPNRVRFRQVLEETLAARTHNNGVAVLVLDLDGFKEINDTLGHQYGDLVLTEIGQRIRRTAGTVASVARLGGDEFAVLLPDVLDVHTAIDAARRLVHALEEPVHVETMDLEVGGSIGIAVAPEHGDDGAVLLRRADVAMFVAKGSSAGWAVFEPSLDSTAPHGLAMLAELRQALHDEDLRVYVQPKAVMTSREIESVEALVRWPHRERGLVFPGDFIPLAERSGLIRPLTSFVLRTSVAAAAEWARGGHPVGIAVNLSPRTLLDPDLTTEIEQLLTHHRLRPDLLTLEITEGSLMSDATRTTTALARLNELGVRLSIDDFGTGYSSLSYLKRLPVQEIKIDRSFVAQLVSDDNDAAIVRSVIDLGTNLLLDVVAEGVEDEATWLRLAELGCDLAQGYHLGRPMPIENFAEWLSAYQLSRQVPTQPVRSIGTPDRTAGLG
jgi:diguanylate cyclase (GGDEF)-like protein